MIYTGSVRQIALVKIFSLAIEQFPFFMMATGNFKMAAKMNELHGNKHGK